MFPIGFMWYFGLNLENRFAVPDFWPEEGTTHRIPFEKEELREMGEQLRIQRLERRRRRLEGAKEVREGEEASKGKTIEGEQSDDGREQIGGKEGGGQDGKFGVGAIERWARGQ